MLVCWMWILLVFASSLRCYLTYNCSPNLELYVEGFLYFINSTLTCAFDEKFAANLVFASLYVTTGRSLVLKGFFFYNCSIKLDYAVPCWGFPCISKVMNSIKIAYFGYYFFHEFCFVLSWFSFLPLIVNTHIIC